MNSYRGKLSVELFGASHADSVGVRIEGLPAGLPVDLEQLQHFLTRRAPGRFAWSSARHEADRLRVLSGLSGGCTDGLAFSAEIPNTDIRKKDYVNLCDIPRPGHADYPAYVKYGREYDVSGGGAFSGRMTAPLCIAGGLCKQFLASRGIRVFARALSVGTVRDDSVFDSPVDDRSFPAVSRDAAERMISAILDAKAAGDSLGGIVECRADGLPVGLGGPLFDGLECRLAALIFSIPAVKGLEFGDGFASAQRFGSENNDPYGVENGAVRLLSNHAGGLLGGMSSGEPLILRAAFKPTPSIALPQKSVSLSRMEPATLQISGRHDPCIVPRAVVCVEAAAAIALYDAIIAEE